jgi:hypothetical protein
MIYNIILILIANKINKSVPANPKDEIATQPSTEEYTFVHFYLFTGFFLFFLIIFTPSLCQ